MVSVEEFNLLIWAVALIGFGGLCHMISHLMKKD